MNNLIIVFVENGRSYDLLGGDFNKHLKIINIDLDHPFPDRRDFFVDKSSS